VSEGYESREPPLSSDRRISLINAARSVDEADRIESEIYGDRLPMNDVPNQGGRGSWRFPNLKQLRAILIPTLLVTFEDMPGRLKSCERGFKLKAVSICHTGKCLIT
jgi:hypothetical protein